MVLSLVVIGSLLTVGVASAQLGTPEPITDEAEDIHNLYLIVTAAAAVVFVAVEAALLYMIFRYRRRSDELPPQTHGNNLLEVIWTTIPIIIVLLLFVSSFVVLLEVEEDADAEALTVNVEGFQFSWTFAYDMQDLGATQAAPPAEEGTVSVTGFAGEENEPELWIPIDEPVEFVLNSNDVIHSFYVRDFLYKLDVIPGRENSFTVTAREPGRYQAQCAELCGINHALMRFHLVVVTRAEFDQYIARLAEEEGVQPPEDGVQEQARVP